MIKLIASDLDGTLLPEGTMDVNPELFDVIRRLKKKGVTFAAVSGREYDSIAKVFEPVKDDIYFIAGNGGVISYQGQIIEKTAIEPELFKEAVEYGKSMDMLLIPYEDAKGIAHSREVVETVKDKKSLGIYIGPEGGFPEEEVSFAMKAGAEPVTLGHRILRTETAGMTLLSILMFMLEED